MNWWVKRLAQGLCIATAFMFYGCLEDDSALGFKNQSRKFDISFIEIPVESSVLLLDSLRTSNYFNDPIRRLLVGSYADPVFGNVTAEAYTQIAPGNAARAKEEGAVFDSAVIYMNFDLYSYGTQNATTLEEFTFHELQEKLTFRNGNDYYSNSNVAYNPFPLGEGREVVDPSFFKQQLDSTEIKVFTTVKGRLNDTYGQELFELWNPSNTTFTDFEKFNSIIKGLAIVGKNNQKVVGFSTGARSKLTLHYHTATDTLTYDFNMSGVVSSSRISIDRSATELAGLTQPNQEFIPVNQDKRYVQSGAPVCVKLDLSKFLEFSDTIENLVINSAELSISNIDDPGANDPPRSLFLQVLDGQNKLKRLASTSNPVQRARDSLDIQLYTNRARTLFDRPVSTLVSKANVFSIFGDTQQEEARLSYNKDDKRYVGYLTLFLQELQEDEVSGDFEKTKFKDLVLYPGNPYAAKSLNRVSYNKNNLKLKIYYTTPTLK